MDKKLAFIVAGLVLVALAAFSVADSATMQVPAVIENGGGQMITIQVDVEDGTGHIYTTTAPLVGIDTQGSERTAVSVAMEKSGRNASGYDVFLTMDVGETRQVDGPSAGAAMTLLTISALSGRHVRSDFTITGTIEGNGGVGPVGGVDSKVEAAAREGLKVVAVPASGEVFDTIMLSGLRQRLNITIIEVGTIEEAEAIAFSPEGSIPPAPAAKPPELLSGLEKYDYACAGCRLDLFAGISEIVVNETTRTVYGISTSGDGDYGGALPTLEKGVADSREMLRNNYYYAAANNAFLTQIDARVLLNASINRRGLGLAISDAQHCLDTISRPAPSRENLGFVAGGDLRATWSRLKLSDVRAAELNISNSEEMLSVYRDTLYAAGWCDIAKRLYSAAGEAGGLPVDEHVLQGYAQGKVVEAGRAFNSSQGLGSDAEMHMKAAQAALNDSHYASAVMDADYVLGFASVENLSGLSDAELRARAESLASTNGETLWGALFFAHARFQMDAYGDGGIGSALRLGSMASLIDADATRMDYLLQHPNEAPAPVATPAPAQNVCSLNDSLLVLALLLVVLLVVSAGLNMIVFTKMKAGAKAREAALRESAGLHKRAGAHSGRQHREKRG